MKPNNPYPIIAGPTASGKTALSIAVAKCLNTEVVCADSMQIYDTVSVGTARPTTEEMDNVPHHLFGFIPLDERYSVARYMEDVNQTFTDIFRRNKTPLLCGGTGLYIQSFMENRQLFEEQPNAELRLQYQRIAETEGNEALFQRLRLVDPVSAQRLHPNDLHRIIRALEVYDTTGMTISEQTRLSHAIPSPYTPCLFVLDFHNRERLYDRINQRVDFMLENGLLEEAREVLTTSPDATVTQAIGYKEFAEYFNGTITLSEAADRLRQQTRHYAKRQLSWFRRMNGHTIWVDDFTSADSLCNHVLEIYSQFLKGGDTV